MNTMAVRSGRGVGVRRLPDHEPHDSGCADLFDTEIAPGLPGLEERRLALTRISHSSDVWSMLALELVDYWMAAERG
jgi:hypothetical protein